MTAPVDDDVDTKVVDDDDPVAIPVADWGTQYRADPAHVTDHLGSDYHDPDYVAPEASKTANGLAPIGVIPPSNYDGEKLSDDKQLMQLRNQLLNQEQAVGVSRTQSSAVSTSPEERDYDPEDAVEGDIIPVRDKEGEGTRTVYDDQPDQPEPQNRDRDDLPPLP